MREVSSHLAKLVFPPSYCMPGDYSLCSRKDGVDNASIFAIMHFLSGR